jgi:site-specific recombinase XerD
MAAIHSFVKFLQRDYPDRISQWQRIQAIPRLKCKTGPVEYLTQKETAVLISVIPSDTKKGIRDKAMLLLLYDSGARVQEIADLTVNDLRLDAPSQVTLTGKGRKTRVVPLMPITVETLREYLKIFRLFKDGESPLFRNRNGEKLTRFGITYLLKGHANVARKNERSILKNMSPHKLRHSKAMHLLELGCTEVVIQHILGHSDLKTTGIYAQSNINMTRAALEKINKTTQENKVEFSWIEDDDIMAMLDRL